MLVEKTFQVTLRVTDPIDFCSNLEKNTMRQLKNDYEGVCFKGCFIESVTGVSKISDCEIDTTNLEMAGSVNVEFTAVTVVYGKWDIIAGFTAREKDRFLIAHKKRTERSPEIIATVFNRDASFMEVVSPGQTVALRVHTVTYPAFQPIVNIIGVLLTCDFRVPTMEVREDATEEELAQLGVLVNLVRDSFERRALLMTVDDKRERVWFFESLLSPLRVPKKRLEALSSVSSPGFPTWAGPKAPKVPDPPKTSDVNIVELVGGKRGAKGVWSREDHIFRSSPLVTRAEAADKGKKSVVTTGKNMLTVFLNEIYQYSEAILEMSETFSEEMIESHENIWTAMRNLQR